jgi:hypothetical protein
MSVAATVADGSAAGWQLEAANPKPSVPTMIATASAMKPATRRAEIVFMFAVPV